MDSSQSDSVPLPSASRMSSAEACLPGAGPRFPATSTLLITAGFPCQDLSVAGKREGLSGSRSSLMFALIGLLSRTSRIRGADGCPNCGATSGPSGMPLCAFECEPQKLELDTSEPGYSLLPTPTASSYGSCRGGGAGRVGKWRKSLQSLGIQHPADWERMMGFPIGHTDATCWETQSVRLPSNSSAAASPPSTNSGEQYG